MYISVKRMHISVEKDAAGPGRDHDFYAYQAKQGRSKWFTVEDNLLLIGPCPSP